MCALSVPTIALTRGTNGEEVLIPQLGLGTYKIPDDEAECVVRDALAVGYRHIDTAQMYGNEAGVGRAIAACGLPRRDLFVTSKLDNPNHRRDDALRTWNVVLDNPLASLMDHRLQTLLCVLGPAPYLLGGLAHVRSRPQGGPLSLIDDGPGEGCCLLAQMSSVEFLVAACLRQAGHDRLPGRIRIQTVVV